MSTTHLTIHDLLRITYTYEMRALEAQAHMQPRPRSDSACSVGLLKFMDEGRRMAKTNNVQMPETCAHLSPPTPSSPEHAILETDFTEKYCRKSRRA